PEDVPLPLRLVVEKALEKDPADRFQTMRDVVVDLRRVVRQSGEASAELRPSSDRGPARYWTALAALALLAAAGAWFLSRSPQTAETPVREYTQLTNFADSATS